MFKFTIRGHPNVRALHKTTLEFTKQEHLSPQGDCIVGVDADFDAAKLMSWLQKQADLKKTRLLVTIEVRKKGFVVQDVVQGELNKDFVAHEEIVIRTSGFSSPRTLLTHADKSSKEIDRRVIDCLKDPSQVAQVLFSAQD